MNGWALLGIFAIIYGVAVVYIAIKKPEKIWKMGKIQGFIKVLGEKGTMIFFIVWAAIAFGLGIWLFTI